MKKRKLSKKEILDTNKKLDPIYFSPKREITPLIPYSGWTIESIMAALQSHDAGQFANPELLYHAMMKEPFIRAAINKRVTISNNFPFSQKCPHDTPKRIQNAALQYEQDFDVVFPNDAQLEVKARTLMFGFCIARHHFVSYNNQILPVIRPWSSGSAYWNTLDRKYYVSCEDGSYVPVVGDPWILFTLGGDRPHLNGLIRSLAFPFARINQAFDRWLNFNDAEATAFKHISGYRLVRENQETGDFVRKTEEVRGGDTIYTPEGSDFNLVTSSGRGSAYNTFRDMVKDAHNEISILILGNNLTQEIESGSFAAAKSSFSEMLRMAQSDVEYLGNPIYKNTNRLWIEKNFTPAIYGESSLIKYRPKPTWEVEDSEEKKNNAEMAQKYAASVSQFLSMVQNIDGAKNIPIDFEETAKRCGIVLKTNKLPEVANQ